MKLLYVTNGISGSGGLERVLSIKSNYFTEKLGYEVHIITLNDGKKEPFYEFCNRVTFHDIKLNRKNPLIYFFMYKKGIEKVLKSIKPDVISVCDDGLKGMLFPVFFGKKIPVVYERHVSINVEQKEINPSFIYKIRLAITYSLMKFGAKKFDRFIVLTKGNFQEWNIKNILVIPNPLPFSTLKKASLDNKKVLVVGRHAYQKGYDMLLEIWSKVHVIFQDWQLEIYGKPNINLGLNELRENFALSDTVHFYDPIKNIQEKYLEASIYLMTSRFEGFGMVLIEAMSYGVPCISFDCPHGPSDIITHDEDGLLVENGNIESFSNNLLNLIQNKEKRKQMGTLAKKNVNRYSPEIIMPQWDKLFNELINK